MEFEKIVNLIRDISTHKNFDTLLTTEYGGLYYLENLLEYLKNYHNMHYALDLQVFLEFRGKQNDDIFIKNIRVVLMILMRHEYLNCDNIELIQLNHRLKELFVCFSIPTYYNI